MGLSPSKKRVVKILQDVSGIIKPSRYLLSPSHFDFINFPASRLSYVFESKSYLI